jgi:hypothetical protein
MPRRITVECSDRHREEIVIGAAEKIPRCSELVFDGVGIDDYMCATGRCRKKREIVWDQSGPQGAPSFRIAGMSKKF